MVEAIGGVAKCETEIFQDWHFTVAFPIMRNHHSFAL
jgi:hypothetical protein